MMCFRDQTFCSAPCKNDKCFRHWTDELHNQALEWWGGDEAPVAFSDFSTTCKEFRP